ncbi:gamma-glutamylcyclotransferase family protein [Noviherbaspirillum saxi]|uniref:Putative gamma-glutamylcyclotransferase n=1 Tax=Noviherbaspirillum saxi TaxID=2320863 RepID=A0A3A3FLU2_9BURK|nr:gamma-glutamylcyclotransferase family protein [Noviherbaspirillum saxi]RJF97142.1 gamma-glutamylcyclotransferase [Noviherbaspirillum saxi]
MLTPVFTYGSLMFPEVWNRVVRGDYRSLPATLPGHARFVLKNETYPGVIAQPGQSVAGLLYFDVSPQDVVALDAFEGDEYRRVAVGVTLDSGETVEAQAYLYLLPQKLSDSPWLPEAFQMQRFIATYCREKLGE